MISSEPLVNGVAEAWVTWGSMQPDGRWYGGGNADFTPDIGGGAWAGDITAVIGSRIFAGTPCQHLMFASEHLGTGTNPQINGKHLWRPCTRLQAALGSSRAGSKTREATAPEVPDSLLWTRRLM
jgi:hypothetical protein